MERKLIYHIRENLTKNNATIVKADKGNSLVITTLHSYHKKIQTFTDSNNFTTASKDHTNKYQKDIRNSINNCPHIIHKDN
jgi:hypothetical protein